MPVNLEQFMQNAAPMPSALSKEGRAWITDNQHKSSFASSLAQQLNYKKPLSQKQIAVVENIVERSKDAAARLASNEQAANTVCVDKLMDAFKKASANGLKKPKLRFAEFEASLAPSTGNNPGAVYIKEKGEYRGKIVDGKLHPINASVALINAISATMDNPLPAAVAYGRQTGTCSCCGRELTNKESIELGIGPICRDSFGF